MNAGAAKALGWKWLAGLWLVAALLAGQANADSGRQQAEAQFAAWREALWGRRKRRAFRAPPSTARSAI
jgi:hypothetical protein